KLGFDYVHVAVDDHSRLAFAQILPDEKGTTCAAFLAAAAEFFARHGIPIREVMTDNAKNYTVSAAFQGQLAALDAKHITTRPHCPWQNGKAERFRSTGPTAPPTSPTSTAPKRSRPGSSTTTTLDHTPPAAADPRSAGCHQPHDRVHLGATGHRVSGSQKTPSGTVNGSVPVISTVRYNNYMTSR